VSLKQTSRRSLLFLCDANFDFSPHIIRIFTFFCTSQKHLILGGKELFKPCFGVFRVKQQQETVKKGKDSDARRFDRSSPLNGNAKLISQFISNLAGKSEIFNWCVPFGTQRVKTKGVSKSEDIERNPKADSRPGTNQA
jgi:hypothetical protein